MPSRASIPDWFWALLPMLLAAALVVPALQRDVFDVDEASTMIVAGARHIGPYSVFDAVDASISRWPGVGLGHALAYVIWGRLVGWSELAARALPWFLGLLTLAWLWRLGRDLFTARVALTATLLLSSSVVFLTYMHIARSYAAAMLFATIVLWGYWRTALDGRAAGLSGRLALVAGATGLLYAHYLGALLLPAVGLFHLIFVRKDRRWLQTAILLFLALLPATPNLADLLAGIDANLARESLRSAALHSPGVVSLLTRYLSSGLLDLQFPLNALLIPVLLLAAAIAALRNRSRGQPPRASRFLFFTTAFLLLLLLGVNEWLQVLERRRVRYLATLWPPVLLLISLTSFVPRLRPVRLAGMLLLALVAFAGISDFIQEGALVRYSWTWKKHPVSIPVTRLLAEQAPSNSLLMVDIEAFAYRNRTWELYTGDWGTRRLTLRPETPVADLPPLVAGFDRITVLYRNSAADRLNIEAIGERFSQAGWLRKQIWQDDKVTMVTLDAPSTHVPDDHAGLIFDRNVRLRRANMELQDGILRVRGVLISNDEFLLTDHSLAVHVIEPGTGNRVAQHDVGIGPGNLVPYLSEIDASDLAPGSYEVQVALYDWQTGERLNALNPETGAQGNMLVLHQFNVNQGIDRHTASDAKPPPASPGS